MGKREKTGSNYGEKLASKSINIRVDRAPNAEVKISEQLYNSLIEERMLTGVEFGDWKTDLRK
jgi:hypothetical protein